MPVVCPPWGGGGVLMLQTDRCIINKFNSAGYLQLPGAGLNQSSHLPQHAYWFMDAAFVSEVDGALSDPSPLAKFY